MDNFPIDTKTFLVDSCENASKVTKVYKIEWKQKGTAEKLWFNRVKYEHVWIKMRSNKSRGPFL